MRIAFKLGILVSGLVLGIVLGILMNVFERKTENTITDISNTIAGGALSASSWH